MYLGSMLPPQRLSVPSEIRRAKNNELVQTMPSPRQAFFAVLLAGGGPPAVALQSNGPLLISRRTVTPGRSPPPFSSEIDAEAVADRTSRLLAAKEASRLTWDDIAGKLGLTNAYTVQLFLGQAKLTSATASKLKETIRGRDVRRWRGLRLRACYGDSTQPQHHARHAPSTRSREFSGVGMRLSGMGGGWGCCAAPRLTRLTRRCALPGISAGDLAAMQTSFPMRSWDPEILQVRAWVLRAGWRACARARVRGEIVRAAETEGKARSHGRGSRQAALGARARRRAPPLVAQEPGVYRTYEAITHYAEAIQMLINEQAPPITYPPSGIPHRYPHTALTTDTHHR